MDGRITPEIVKQMADLAGLNVDEKRAATLAPQLEALRRSIDAMDQVDLTDVEPLVVYRPEQG